ncbi:MAG: pilus assembly protein TadG-related protein [Pseudomonas sp.]|nr:pilus assembly protein TadG-related protein [Pseudomonas sp.]
MLYLSSSKQSQRGAFSIMAAGTLLMSLLFLVLVLDSGRLYMEQRHLQKIADTAALESIARIEGGNCSASPAKADQYARQNAAHYDFLSGPKQSMDVTCVDLTSENGLIVISKNKEGKAVEGRAVQVETYHEVPASLIIKAQSMLSKIPSTVKLSASAVAAREEPTAVFTVGSQLLRLENNKLLGQLLKTVGLNPETLTLLDKDGLVDAKITPAGLLKALGIKVGIHELKALSPRGLVDLVDTRVGLLGISKLLNVSAEVVGADSVLTAELDLIGQKILSDPLLKDVRINLLGDDDRPGLLKLASHTLEPVGSALEASINLGEILTTAIFIGVQETGRSVVIPGLNLLGQTVELGIVEPPSIGIGPVGTTAYNAQVRLYLGVDTNNLLGGILRWLTETILGTRVNLPIWIDVISGYGTLEKISCDTEIPTVDISVDSKILNVCIGKIPADLKWSGSASCDSNLQEDELIKLLHIPILSGKSHIPALSHYEYLEDMEAGETVSTGPNKLALGNTVEGVVDGLLDLLSGLFRRPNAASGGSDLNYSQAGQEMLLKNLATEYLKESALVEGGLYNIERTTQLIFNGIKDKDGNQTLPPLVKADWEIERSIPKSCLLTSCPVSQWGTGLFSEAFKAYSEPKGLLDLLLPSQRNGYEFCGNLITATVDWNACTQRNLVKLLKTNPEGVNVTENTDGASIATRGDTVNCNGLLCIILKPVILLLKPILNGVGHLLTVILADVLGIEIGRTDVTVHSISCGAPRLVR